MEMLWRVVPGFQREFLSSLAKSFLHSSAFLKPRWFILVEISDLIMNMRTYNAMAVAYANSIFGKISLGNSILAQTKRFRGCVFNIPSDNEAVWYSLHIPPSLSHALNVCRFYSWKRVFDSQYSLLQKMDIFTQHT